jgi:hypothetical protein
MLEVWKIVSRVFTDLLDGIKMKIKSPVSSAVFSRGNLNILLVIFQKNAKLVK